MSLNTVQNFLGMFGVGFIFTVSSQKVLTFRNATRSFSGRWTDHEILRMKPRPEFLGPELEEVSLEVELSAQRGLKPRGMIKNIKKYVEDGGVRPLFIGGEGIGWFTCRSAEVTNMRILNTGELVQATVQLKLTEYIWEKAE